MLTFVLKQHRLVPSFLPQSHSIISPIREFYYITHFRFLYQARQEKISHTYQFIRIWILELSATSENLLWIGGQDTNNDYFTKLHVFVSPMPLLLPIQKSDVNLWSCVNYAWLEIWHVEVQFTTYFSFQSRVYLIAWVIRAFHVLKLAELMIAGCTGDSAAPLCCSDRWIVDVLI